MNQTIPLLRPDTLVHVAETDAHEGPVSAADEDALYFPTLRRETVAIKGLSLADGSVAVVRAEVKTATGVYRYEPVLDRVAVVADSLDKPNGLAFSPDKHVLYVGDNGAPHHLLAFDVAGGTRLTGGQVVAVSTPEHLDGIKVDSEERVYASSASGVQVSSPSGDTVGEIDLPGTVNFTFGDRTETPSSSRPTRRYGPPC